MGGYKNFNKKIAKFYQENIWKQLNINYEIDWILYRIWQFRFCSRKEIYLLFFNWNKTKINNFIKYLVGNNFLIKMKFGYIDDIYKLTKKGHEKINVKYNKVNINFKNINHEYAIIEYINKTKINNYISNKELILLLQNLEGNNFKDIRLPDLVIMENSIIKAIEIELTVKAKQKYENILLDYNLNYLVNYYDQVVWVCKNQVIIDVISKIINDLKLNQKKDLVLLKKV